MTLIILQRKQMKTNHAFEEYKNKIAMSFNYDVQLYVLF